MSFEQSCRKIGVLPCVGLLVGLMAATPAEGGFVDNFDSDTKTTGALSGQDGWTLSTIGSPAGHDAQVVTTPAPFGGDQSVVLTDDQASAFDLTRDVLLAESESDGAIIRFAVKAIGGFDTTMLVAPIREFPNGAGTGFDPGVSAMRSHDIAFNEGGSIGLLVNNGDAPGATTVLGTALADRWYEIEMVSTIDPTDADRWLVDLSVTDTVTNVVSSQTGIDGGVVSIRTHVSALSFTSSSATTGQYQIDSVSLAIPEPGSMTLSLAAVGGMLLRRRRGQA